MPRLSRWLVRAALLYFVLGFTAGTLLLVDQSVGLHPALIALRPVHIEALLFGWMLQFVFGVGSWILPRVPYQQSQWPVVIALILINLGVWMVGIGSVLSSPAWVIALGRAAEIGAVAAFATHIWPRVRSIVRKSHPL